MKTFLAIAALIGATVLVYSNMLSGPFIYDDRPIIVKNPLIRSLDMKSFFATPYWGFSGMHASGSAGGLYRPIPMISYALNYRVGGLDPKGYRLVNLLLHIGVSLLLGLLALQLGMTRTASWAAAAVFALLPVHTEAVSNVVGRAELFAAFFLLCAWQLLTPKASALSIVAAGLCVLCALFSKESAAAFLPGLMLLDWLFRKGRFKDILRERLIVWLSLAGCLFLYLQWRYLILGRLFDAGGMSYFSDQSVAVVLLTLAKFFWLHYAQPMVLGWRFCAEFSRPAFEDAHLASIGAWMAALWLALTLMVVLWRTLRRREALAGCLLLFFVLLLPMSNLLIRLEVIGAERFLYLPSLGYALAVGIVLAAGIRRNRQWGSIGCALLLAGYGTSTFLRNRVWQSEERFWETTTRASPSSPRAWTGLGAVRMSQNRHGEAKGYFLKAIELQPRLIEAHYNLATCFLLEGDLSRAKRGYEFVLTQKPEEQNTLFHLAQIAEKQGSPAQAASYYKRMLAVDPLDTVAEKNLRRLTGLTQPRGGG